MYRYQYELYHYGIAGRSGRYPWGSGGRPYQRLEKPKKRIGIIKKIKQRKVEKQRADREAASRKAAEEKQKLADDKERILRQGTASEVLKYKKEIGLTNQELQDALNRIKTTEELGKYAAKEIKTGWDVFNATTKRMKDVNMFTSAALDSYKYLQEITKFIDEASKKAEKEKTKGS